MLYQDYATPTRYSTSWALCPAWQCPALWRWPARWAGLVPGSCQPGDCDCILWPGASLLIPANTVLRESKLMCKALVRCLFGLAVSNIGSEGGWEMRCMSVWRLFCCGLIFLNTSGNIALDTYKLWLYCQNQTAILIQLYLISNPSADASLGIWNFRK